MPRDGDKIAAVIRRRKAANKSTKPTHPSQPSAPIADVSNGIGSRDDQTGNDAHVLPVISAIVAQIVELQKIRRFCIKSQSRCDRSMDSLIAQAIGYNPDATMVERKAVFRQAGGIRKSVEKGGEGQSNRDTHAIDAIPAILHLIPLSASSRKLWDDRRDEVEKKMVELAGQLHIAEWAKTIRGFGLLNLAIIVGEAGIPIGDYRTVSGLWKRMGMAVIEGERQRKKTNKEAAAAHGYSPKRRAEIYVVGSVSVFMAQKPGMPYRDIYDTRRKLTASRIAETADLTKDDPAKWTLGRCDNDARRVMTKALLRDLWIEWRRASRSRLLMRK